jgi:hypothetical protein
MPMQRGESVAIFGDYDVDGATSSALLALFLRAGGLDPLVHIPDRIFEGYGPNVEAIRSLAARGAKLAGHRSIAAPPAWSLWPKRNASASMSSSSTITRPTNSSRPPLLWSIPTGSMTSPGSAISPPSVLTFRHRGGGQPRAAQARLLDGTAAGAGFVVVPASGCARHGG